MNAKSNDGHPLLKGMTVAQLVTNDGGTTWKVQPRKVLMSTESYVKFYGEEGGIENYEGNGISTVYVDPAKAFEKACELTTITIRSIQKIPFTLLSNNG